MDITSLYYFREVAKELHITNTAIRLFVSQQTLSNHIQRLEDYYGVKLFYRKPKLRLTDAGEKMLIFAEDMLSEETKLKDILSDIEKQDKGVLRVGASAIRANRCFPTILESFSKEYPNVEIRLTDYVSSKLEELIATGDLDLAICVENTPYPGLISKPLPADQIYLCVSDDLLHKYYGDMSETIKNISIDGANIRYFVFSLLLIVCFQKNKKGNYRFLKIFKITWFLSFSYLVPVDLPLLKPLSTSLLFI